MSLLKLSARSYCAAICVISLLAGAWQSAESRSNEMKKPGGSNSLLLGKKENKTASPKSETAPREIAATEAAKNDSASIKDAEKTSKNDESNKGGESRKDVLNPSQFFGLASFGYAAAKACPQVMEKLFCYCGCDLTDSHNSLLDCFTSLHGVDCHICQEEAILANKMNKDGDSITVIQQTIDEKFASQYPFEEDTPTYKKYKANRLYLKNENGESKFGKEAAGPEAPDDAPVSSKPKLKPGREVGKCCAGGEHKDQKDQKNQKNQKDQKLQKVQKKSDSKPKTGK